MGREAPPTTDQGWWANRDHPLRRMRPETAEERAIRRYVETEAGTNRTILSNL